jgi:hypothetical protein
MKKALIKSTVVVAMALGFVAQVSANTITLFNTGVGSGGAPLPDGTLNDSHYSLIVVPGSTTTTRVRTTGAYPLPPWFGNDALSAWIGPNNDNSLNGPVGNYVYRTTFDLTGLNPLTASIVGGWSTDNNGVQILLNGANTGNPGTSFTQFSTGFASFSIGSGFVSGINYLDFVVYNGGGPTGLRVEMSGTASVPDGGLTAILLGMGMLGLGTVRRMIK